MPTTSLKKASSKSCARLDVRLQSHSKALIEEAAALSGQSLSEYVVSTLLQQSNELLQHYHHIRLSNRDRNQFLALLDTQDKPNPALARAARKFKRSFGKMS